MLDLLIRDVDLVDGTGKPAYHGSLGVKDGRITFAVAGEAARETVEATGLTLCPGFIDAHSHGDLSIGTPHGTISKVSQGVTTEIGGQCGQSAFPVDPRFLREIGDVMAFSPDFARMPYDRFSDLSAFLRYARTLPLSNNMTSLIGHNTLRASVMGVENRAPTPQELGRMKERLQAAMEQGALGLSSGLVYIPGAYSQTEELIELCKVIRPYGGVYATHMRDEARHVVESVREAIAIAEQAGVPLVISHHKVCGRPFWGKSEETLRLIDEAAARGVKVMLDQYPYEANMTALDVCIPPQYFSEGLEAMLDKLRDQSWRAKIAAEMNDPDGGYDNFYLNCGGFSGVFISVSPQVPEAEGLTVAEYAAHLGKPEMDTYFDLLLANKGKGNGIYFAMDPAEVERIYCHPRTMVGSDGLCFSLQQKGHPRAFSTFIRPLTQFVQKGLVTFEEAIHKQTGLSAGFWDLPGKGRLAEGFDADLVLLDRAALEDRASYQNSNERAGGVRAVYVQGTCIYRDGELTGAHPGRFLRRGER